MDKEDTDMPEIGEKRKAHELGYKGPNGFIWSACPECGKERWVSIYLYPRRCRSCSFRMRRASEKTREKMRGRIRDKSPHWNGGRFKVTAGYIKVKLYPDDFFYSMANNKGYVMEHRLVVAKALGRCLHSWEIVHHKGERFKGIKNKADNLEDNLQLVSDDRHKQITILQQRIAYLEKRVILLEAEKIVLLRENGKESLRIHQGKGRSG